MSINFATSFNLTKKETSGGGGSAPAVVEPLNVTPTTSAQTITAPTGTDGYSPVNVSAVTNSIDSNIQPGNIKKDVTILGVTGTLESQQINNQNISVTQNGVYTAEQGYTGLGTVSVNVSGGGGGINREVENGVYTIPSTNFNFSLPNNATDLGLRALYYAFNLYPNHAGIKNINLGSLTSISGNYAMQNACYSCTNLENIDLSSLVSVTGSYAMQNAFNGCTGIQSLDLGSLTTINADYAFSNAFSSCKNLQSLDLSSLTTINGTEACQYAFNNSKIATLDLGSLTSVNGQNPMGFMFSDCTLLQTVDLSSLTTIGGTQTMVSAFSGCSALQSVNFENLTTIGTDTSNISCAQLRGAFAFCSNLVSLTFPKLEAIYCTGANNFINGTFANNGMVQKLYFPKLTTITYGSGASSSYQSACLYVFGNCNSLTELHFGAANQAAIEASPGYSTAWGRGAGNVTIYFDL